MAVKLDRIAGMFVPYQMYCLGLSTDNGQRKRSGSSDPNFKVAAIPDGGPRYSLAIGRLGIASD